MTTTFNEFLDMSTLEQIELTTSSANETTTSNQFGQTTS
ncbi:unnamed protein product, partial [Rotaria sp. Silwood1]